MVGIVNGISSPMTRLKSIRILLLVRTSSPQPAPVHTRVRQAGITPIIRVEVVGGGGAGARGASTSTGGGGGAGGGYNKITNFTFATPGTTTASVSVGIGGVWTSSSITNGGDTWFNDTVFPTSGSKVGARGGPSPATFNTATGGTAAATSTFFPTTSPPARAGGNGANGTSASVGGGGGGGGGPNGAGGNASSNTGGTGDGGTVTAGAAGNPGTAFTGTEFDATHGIGGGGGGSNASAGAGKAAIGYGGGAGAGSRSNGTGANGFQGIIVLSWVATTTQAITFSSNTTETLNTRKPKTVPTISSAENVLGSAFNVLYRRQTGPGIADTKTLTRSQPQSATISIGQNESLTALKRIGKLISYFAGANTHLNARQPDTENNHAWPNAIALRHIVCRHHNQLAISRLAIGRDTAQGCSAKSLHCRKRNWSPCCAVSAK